MNNNTHPCANKCGEFKEGGQCFYCLIQQIEKREFELGVAIEDAYVNIGDDEHIENHIGPNCRINCFQDDTEIGTRTVDIEAENERLKTENLAMQSKVDELQNRVDLLEGKIKEALNTVYAMKGKADCDHLTDKEQSFVYGFGYELHEILKEEQALKGGEA